MTFEEIVSKTKKNVQALLTAENTDTITAIVSQLDDLNNANKNSVKEIGELKERIVSYVKHTQFADKPKDPIEPAQKSFDDVLAENLAKIEEKRKK